VLQHRLQCGPMMVGTAVNAFIDCTHGLAAYDNCSLVDIVYCNIYSTILQPKLGAAVDSQLQDVAVIDDKPANYLRDPYPYFAHKRGRAGIFHGTVMDYSKTPESLRPQDSFAAMSFEAVNKTLRNSQVFSSTMYDSTIGLFMGPTILAMDGKKHRDHRNLVSAAFKPKALARWEPTIVRPVCNALIDEFIGDGEVDLVRRYTFEFPTRVIATLLGLPEEDLPMFHRRAVELIGYAVDYERAFQASAALKEYFLQQIDQRRSKPTDDIIGDLVDAEVDGEKLTDEAIYSFLRLLLPAGLETTYRSAGNLLFLLLTHPDQFTAVQADYSLIPQAIEEGLRFETPLTTVQRFTTEDAELEGVKIPARSVVDVCLGSANRDERRWENSEQFDIFRPHLPHISFAVGEHTCLGLHLTRMEARVALECLLTRLSNITLLTDDDPHIHGQPFRSPTALPVRFDVR
jgi:cytochrome P450